MTTKLYVDDLSTVSLSADYLYAKDSNIKTDVKIEPVDNGGEKIAIITVNGEATEISAKQIDVDSEYSMTSENPLQNKILAQKLYDISCCLSDYADVEVAKTKTIYETISALHNITTIFQF